MKCLIVTVTAASNLMKPLRPGLLSVSWAKVEAEPAWLTRGNSFWSGSVYCVGGKKAGKGVGSVEAIAIDLIRKSIAEVVPVCCEVRVFFCRHAVARVQAQFLAVLNESSTKRVAK